MATIAEMITRSERELAEARTLRDAKKIERTALTAGLSETDSLSPEASARHTELTAEIRSAKNTIAAKESDLDNLRAEAADDDKLTRAAAETKQTVERVSPAVVTSEARTYTRQTAKGEVSFFRDAFAYTRGAGPDVRDRIERHAREVEVHGEMVARAASTSSFAGLVIPQYLPDYAALALRAGRPVANVSNRHELPDQGMNLVIQRGTTGAGTAVQATENSAVQSTDEVWADLTVPVRTIAGQQQVSRQSLERGWPGLDELIYTDLARAYAANLDNQIINGSGASGQVLGILSTAGINAATAFGAAPTAANFALKIAGQRSAVDSAGAGVFAKVIVMHPRRYNWLAGTSDSTGRPIVTSISGTGFNPVAWQSADTTYSGDGGANYYSSVPVGIHNATGLPIVTDLNIPTNVGTNVEDVALVADTAEWHLWEDGDGMPRQLDFEQTLGNQLTTTLVVYGYVAFTAGRYPVATGKLGGLDSTATFGLVAPTF
jgi:HK97 family phage major capsid protein